jgi:hypothetical protein
MTVDQGIASAISFIKVLFAIVAIVIGGMTIWKLGLSGFNVDAKSGAEIAACFAASYFFLK